MRIEEIESLELFEEYKIINLKELTDIPMNGADVLTPICIDKSTNKINGVRFLLNSFVCFDDKGTKEQIIQGFLIDDLIKMELVKVKKGTKKEVETNNSEVEFLRQVVLNFSKRGE
jgi:hypothetical protein